MTAVIDYDAGNILSVKKALSFIGEESAVTNDPYIILNADRVILPGVGSFGDAMQNLKSLGLIEVIDEVIEKGTPFLGICLGLQLLFERSDESPGVNGLGYLKGNIMRIPAGGGRKIPHIGWNSLSIKNKGKLFKDIESSPYVYFVHSYYLEADEPDIVTAMTEYGVCIHASVEKENIFACQFHPEKSSATGLSILKNFTAVTGGER